MPTLSPSSELLGSKFSPIFSAIRGSMTSTTPLGMMFWNLGKSWDFNYQPFPQLFFFSRISGCHQRCMLKKKHKHGGRFETLNYCTTLSVVEGTQTSHSFERRELWTIDSSAAFLGFSNPKILQVTSEHEWTWRTASTGIYVDGYIYTILWYDTIWYDTIRYDTIWYDTIRNDMT